tara:strand:+ start:1637 stop:2239 length:603 start_codon:yes stop_codon:yes gene_type:complete
MSLAEILYQQYDLPFKKLKPEAAICIDFADKCRFLTRSGELQALWFTVPNEARRSIHQRTIFRAMGLLPGAPDYIFIGSESAVCIEFKTAKGTQSIAQKAVESYCRELGITYEIARSSEEGLNILQKNGLLLYHKMIQKKKKGAKPCVSKNSGQSIQVDTRTATPKKPQKKRTSKPPKSMTQNKSSKARKTTPTMLRVIK